VERQHIELGMTIGARSVQPLEVRPDHAAQQDLSIGIGSSDRLGTRVEHRGVILQCSVPPERHVLLVVDLV
jgi:hypothetical protein